MSTVCEAGSRDPRAKMNKANWSVAGLTTFRRRMRYNVIYNQKRRNWQRLGRKAHRLRPKIGGGDVLQDDDERCVYKTRSSSENHKSHNE